MTTTPGTTIAADNSPQCKPSRATRSLPALHPANLQVKLQHLSSSWEEISNCLPTPHNRFDNGCGFIPWCGCAVGVFAVCLQMYEFVRFLLPVDCVLVWMYALGCVDVCFCAGVVRVSHSATCPREAFQVAVTCAGAYPGAFNTTIVRCPVCMFGRLPPPCVACVLVCVAGGGLRFPFRQWVSVCTLSALQNCGDRPTV